MPRRITQSLAAAAVVGWAAVAAPPTVTAQDSYPAVFEGGEIPPSAGEPLDAGAAFGLDAGYGAGMAPGMTPGMMGPAMYPGMHPGAMGAGMMGPGSPGMHPGMHPGMYPGGYGGGPRTSRLRAMLSVFGRPASGIPGYYNWMRPVRHPLYRVPVTYQKYWPRHYYTGGPTHSPTEAAPRLPIVYQPTDTTQLGVTWQHVPTWQPDPQMVPPTPWPWDWHHLAPAQVYREHPDSRVVGASLNLTAGHAPAGFGPAGYGAPGVGMNGFGMNGFGMSSDGLGLDPGPVDGNEIPDDQSEPLEVD